FKFATVTIEANYHVKCYVKRNQTLYNKGVKMMGNLNLFQGFTLLILFPPTSSWRISLHVIVYRPSQYASLYAPFSTLSTLSTSLSSFTLFLYPLFRL